MDEHVDQARVRREQQEEHEMATEARAETVRRHTPEPVIPRSVVETFRDIGSRLAEFDADQVAAGEAETRLSGEFEAAIERLERFAPVGAIPIGEALEGVGPEDSRRRMAAMGAVLAERLPELYYVAPERLRACLSDLLAAADTGI